MKIRVRYFASIREALGAGETLEFTGAATVAAARDALIARSPAHAAALARGRALRSALNQTLCDEAAALSDDAELAFFPPVTGG
jgi:molybdopterin synthase sulfur carrier subunit